MNFKIKDFMNSNRAVIEISVIAWIIIAVCYCLHVPYDHLNNDFGGHLQYTSIIVKEKRLPVLNEGMETFQPPMYYVLSSWLAPKALLSGKVATHVNYVRAVSIIYGAFAVFIIAFMLRDVTSNTVIQLLITFFLMTTPTFVFMFTSYNNDSLMTVLCIAVVLFSYELYKRFSWKLGLFLFTLSALAMNTKHTALFTIMAIVFACVVCYFFGKSVSKKSLVLIVSILLLSIATVAPFVLLRNYKATGDLFLLCPTYAAEQPTKKFGITEIKNLLGIAFKISELQSKKPDYTHEWDDPWLHSEWSRDYPRSKRYDYWATAFVTSLVGEGIFQRPEVKFIWLMYLIHLVAYLVGILHIRSSSLTKLSGLAIGFIHSVQIFSILFFIDLPHRAMGYRYISFSWILWGILYASALSHNYKFSPLLKGVVAAGIIVQLYILATISGHL